ncbi:MAG TPA: 30S ribosomal protein S8 [Armatimonadota bacterium]|nr:30S ribosomal protein S8 [Armatimonadota bacterium]
MPVTDSIADMLTRVRNAASAGHDAVSVPLSRVKNEIARILKEEGYIEDFEITETDKPTPILRMTLKYGPRRQPVIRGLKRASRPGLRHYVGWREIPRVQGGLGVAVLTTSRGVMTDRQARTERVGGELLCLVW